MHRSAAPDKDTRQTRAKRDGATVTHQEQDPASRRADHQGAGHDERGDYGSAGGSHSPDQVKSKR